MSRSKIVRKTRKIDADPIYNSKLISKIINCAMYDGKKDTAMKGFYGAIDKLKDFFISEYIRITSGAFSDTEKIAWAIEYAINKIAPNVEIRTRRIGGANYQIPVSLSPHRQLSLAIRWLITGARLRSERGMIDKFAAELKDIFNDRGEAIKKRETVRKTADANKAFAHYGANG